MPVTVVFFGSLSAVSVLTGWLSLLIYCHLPDAWLCDFDEKPGPAHLPENRCPRRRLSLFCMAATVFAALMMKLQGLQQEDPGILLPPGEEGWVPSVYAIREILLLLLAAAILLPAALSDADYYIIPDQLCALAAAAALLEGFFQGDGRGLLSSSIEETLSFSLSAGGMRFLPVRPAAGGLLCFLLLLLSFGLGRLFSGKEGLGMGDVKLMTACSALASSAAGPEDWALASFSVYSCSVMSSAVWFSLLLLSGRAFYGEARPMAPWIVLSTLIVMAAF